MTENLEDPVVAPPVEAVVEPPADPAELEPGDLVDGEKAKGLIAALKATREEAKTAKVQAARVAGLEQQIAQLTPYANFVQNNPQLLQPPQPVQPPPGGDPDLMELAKSLDYYDENGNPDLDRAKRHQSIIDRQARKIAAEMVGPLAQSTYNDAATRNWNQAVTEKLPNGQAIDPNLLSAAWKEVSRNNPALLADPRVARVVVNTVMAEQWRQSPLGTSPPPPPGPPVHTEGTGASPRQPRVQMTDAEKKIIGQRMDSEKYLKLTKDFVPGRTNVLEDE